MLKIKYFKNNYYHNIKKKIIDKKLKIMSYIYIYIYQIK